MIGGVSQAGDGLFSLVRAGKAGGSPASASARAETQDAKKSNAGATAAGDATLTPEQEQQVAQLRQRDAEVRQHEAAHQAAGGAAAGGASFEYQRGPDGKNYAIGGEVQVDVSRGSTPESTVAKMDQVKAAALAPAEPSSQDQRVAAMADAIKMQAQQEARKQGGADGAKPEAGKSDGAADSVGGATTESNGTSDESGQKTTNAGDAPNTGAASAVGTPAVNRRAAGAYGAAALIGAAVPSIGFAVNA